MWQRGHDDASSTEGNEANEVLKPELVISSLVAS
jgi:hypothetical protein